MIVLDNFLQQRHSDKLRSASINVCHLKCLAVNEIEFSL